MDHLPKLIEDLALILLVGAIVTLLFKSIRQPIVLGYILAGFFVGPHMSLIPTVADIDNVQTLAEIGVIFLLFSLGLEFNLKKVLHIGGPSSITALVEIIFISVSGYALGKILGWSNMDSIFLGGMLASSSTTIIIKAFEDLGVRTQHYTRVVFGVLIVEDIVVILLLVLLPTIAMAQHISGLNLLFTIAKIPFFLIITFVTGVFVLPTFLKRVKNYMNEEVLLIFYVGLCLGMVVLATKTGVSAELGAFLMGFILAESTSAERVEQLIKPVKNLFAAVFFVSIGMMIDPNLILEHKLAVVAVTLLTIFGKLVSTTGGAVISGQPLKQSVMVGMSMAQIGEFAFIVATLGLSLGVISDYLFPVAVGASAMTTFTTPYMIKYSERAYQVLEKLLPGKWLSLLERYSHTTQRIRAEKNWKKVVKTYGSIILINGFLVIALLFLSLEFLAPFFETNVPNPVVAKVLSLLITAILIFPFLWGVMARKPRNLAYRELWADSNYSRGPLVLIELLRIVTGLVMIGFLVNEIFSTRVAVITLVPFMGIVLFIFSKQVNKFYNRMEGRFMSNLNSHSIRQQLTDSLNLSPWDAHIIELKVRPHAQFAGDRLDQLAWREIFGINIAYVRRGEEVICAPSGSCKLYPHDKVGIIATEEQMKVFKPVFDENPIMEAIGNSIEDIVISSIRVNESNRLKGISIKDSGIREQTKGLILGIERKDTRIFNPDSTTVFEWNDIVWIAGDRDKIKTFNG